MNGFAIKAKKVLKKMVALSVGAAMFGATMGGAVAAADLANLHSAGTILSSTGKLDAYVVVGKDADSADVVGAIDIASAFAQKAQGATGTGSGIANIATQTYEGTKSGTDPAILENYTTAINTGFHSGSISNYTKTVNTTLNWTTLQQAEIIEANVMRNMSFIIPSGKVKLRMKLQKEISGASHDETNNATESIGSYIKLLGTDYYIVNWTTNQNITLGSATEHKDQALPATLTTSDGYTVTATAGSSSKVILQVTKPDGTKSTLVEKESSESVTFGDLTVVVDSILGSSYVSLNLVQSKLQLKNNDNYPDSNWKLTLEENSGAAEVILTSTKDVSVQAKDEYAAGPGGEFRVDYIDLGYVANSWSNVSVSEGQSVTVTLSCYEADHTVCSGDGATHWNLSQTFPGATVKNTTKAQAESALKGEITTIWDSLSNAMSVVDGGVLVIVEPDGSKFFVNATYNDTTTAGLLFYSNSTNPFTVGSTGKVNSGTNITTLGTNNIAFEIIGTSINVGTYGSGSDTDAQKTNALWGEFWIRKDVDGVFQNGVVTKPVGYGVLLNFDASSGDSNDKLTITEPDGNVITINFNDTTTGMLFNNAKSNLGVTESGKNTTYQSIVFFNETADTNSYYDSQANAITVQTSSTDTYKYNTTAGTITILVPEKYVEFGIGSYVYSNAQDLAVGGTGTFSSTKVKVNSITGTTSINYIAPSADSNAVGHLSSDAVLSTPAKPLILVGGPAANPLVATAGLTVDDFKVDGAYWSGHALVKLYDSVAALNSQTVLVIAGVDADDTVWASRMIAQEIVNNMASPLAINGTEVWLSTAVTSTSEITTATKS